MENILRLTIKDLDDVVESLKTSFPEDDIKREDWIELLEDKKTFFYAIKENNTIKAYIAIYNWKGEDDYIKIMSIATHPDHRQKGYAHILMKYTIDEMLKDDMNVFKAETRQSNIKMQKVFEDFGYKYIKKEEDCFTNPVEAGYKYSLKM